MHMNFAEVLKALGADAAFTIANAARPTPDYLFATLLPERPMPTYDAKSGTMTVRSTMAGMVGMDSKFPPSGIVEASTFSEGTAKIANEVTLPEAAIRELQQLLMAVRAGGGVSVDMTAEALNFLDKVVLQPHMDTAEWLRAQALVTGAISWTFNKKVLSVDYGVPAANLLTNRTGNDAYDGSASKFWTDIRALQSALRYNVRAFIAHPDTIDVILANTVNSLAVVSQSGNVWTFRRYVSINSQNVFSSDSRDTVSIIAYDKEGEVYDAANDGTTVKIPFMPTGKILAVGNNTDSGYRVGQGSTPDPLDQLALGYTHIAPTVEGGGVPGRWADLKVPDDMPMQLRGRAVSNLLPVIEAPAKIAVASTDMPA